MILDQVYKSEHQRLVESYVYKDPLFEQWKNVSRVIAERKMSEKEILDLFNQVETGMTDKATGANRTWAGKGKDVTANAYTSAKDALSGVMNSIQNSAPIAAVDVAYDQATDAVAGLTGGQQGTVMQAIKNYRNLVKEYPKASGFAKAALVAIAGLATGGAGLPAIAGLTYALDSAIKGDKLSSVIGKGAGAAALSAAGQAIASKVNATDTVTTPDNLDPNQYDKFTTTDVQPGGETTDYIVKKGDTLSDIAKANKVSVDDLMKANAGQTIVKPNGESITWNDANAMSDVNAMGDYVGPGTGVQQDYSVTTSPKISNPDVLAVGQHIKIPAPTGSTPYAGDVGLAGDTWKKIGTGAYPHSQISANQAAKYGLKESIKFKKISAEQMIDQKLTVLSWALNESVGKRSDQSMVLTTAGVLTVFENINRYAKAVVKEANTGPGRDAMPDEYRPDMPGGSGVKSKPGMIGRGLNWLDRGAKKVGGALSNFGHQFTTNVTKEKLKMNWHQAGKPSDSDAIAAFLIKQGVPQGVVKDVYGSMGIPYSSVDDAQPAVAKGGAQTSLPYYGINPATKKAWTVDELQAKAAASNATAATTPATTPTIAKSTALPQATSANTAGMPSKVTYGKGFEKKPTTQFPSFGTVGQAAGAAYKTASAPAATTPSLPKPVTSKISPTMPGAPVMPKAPAAPALASGPGGSYNKKTGAATLGGKPMVSLKDLPASVQKKLAPQVAETVDRMLENVRTFKDVENIKKYVDKQFVALELTESTIAQRKKLMDHVTRVSSIRRRMYASQTAK